VSTDRQWTDWLIRLIVVAAAGSVLWIGTLFVLSVNSEERLLVLGEEKLFGGFDPHLLVALVDSQRFDSPNDDRSLVYRLTLRFRSDAVDIRIRPSYLEATVLDGQGRRFEPERIAPPDGARVFDGPLDWELLAGRSATQDFYFELPRDTDQAVLWIRDPHWLARLIPGSETSFVHGKKVFAVQ
jgi:hypothetical protein